MGVFDWDGDGGQEGGVRERWTEWLLLDGDRITVATVLTGAVFAVLIAAVVVGIAPVAERMPLFYLFSALIGGNLTLITVVISINQLLLSRELESPGETRSQMEDVVAYRSEVEEATERAVAPIGPRPFLHTLLQNTRRQAQELGGLAAGSESDEVREDVDALVTGLTADVDDVDGRLERAGEGVFNALSVALVSNFAEWINEARLIRATYGEELTEETWEGLDRIIDRLEQIDVARKYFNSIYLEEELSQLSRLLLYVGVPVEVVMAGALLVLTAPAGTSVLETSPLLVPTVTTVGFAPLALLFSFVLRTATVTQHTTATFPFTSLSEGT